MREQRLAIIDLLQNRVIPLLPAPPALTADDFWESLLEHLPLERGPSYDAALHSLLSRLPWAKPGLDASWRTSDIFRINVRSNLEAQVPRDESLLVLPSGMELLYEGTTGTDLHLRVCGVCSESAILRAAENLEAILDCVLPHFFTHDPMRARSSLAQNLEELSEAPEKDFVSLADELADATNQFTTATGRNQQIAIRLACRGVAACFAPMTKKEPLLNRRIRNAITLLVESASQSNDGVILALRFAAIEALIATKEESGSITDELARNASTLLFSNPDDREAAMRQIRRLYGLRSKVLHGSNLNVNYSEVVNAIDLSVAVLRAVLEWTECTHRTLGIGEDLGQEFFRQLANAVVTGKRVVGVSDDLWKCDEVAK